MSDPKTPTRRLLSRLFILIGLGLLAWSGSVIAAGAIGQHTGEREFAAQLAASQAAAPQFEDGEDDTEQNEPGEEEKPFRSPWALSPPPIGTTFGKLEVPSLDISVIIREGSPERVLKLGPGHVEGTAYPGDPGNVVISGHRDATFKVLGDIKLGDRISLTVPYGKYYYEVQSTDIVEGGDTTSLHSNSTQELTLLTCYPFDFVGAAPNRFRVKAARIEE